MIEKIQKFIELTIPVCSSWITQKEDGMFYLIDPNDNKEISEHYGATHVAAAFIIWAKHIGNETLYKQGLSLLQSLLARWNHSKTLPAFHFDFNNFAVSIVEPLVDEKNAKCIREIINTTLDSNHDTINWLPMRWAVNKKRVEWTSNNRYESVIAKCRKTIEDATNMDGGIEDRLPHGMSFNLQYNIATVAILQYLRVQGERMELGKELGFLLNAVAPDGDINYQGRGTNQIFAWGLWIYLLSSSGQKSALLRALDYLEPRLNNMLEHNNMMLNEWDGKEKFHWWDYHYASVYIAHFLLWLVLALIDNDKAKISPIFPTTTATGLHIYRSENFFVSWFEGRKEYLAEKGPAIAAIWTKNQGMICKGTFAPWQGLFGNKYIYDDIVLKNYCGIFDVKQNKDWSNKRYIKKIIPCLIKGAECTLKPMFYPISVKEESGFLLIRWDCSGEHLFVNIPAVYANCSFQLFIDDKNIPILCNSAIKNQYGWVNLFQSRKSKVRKYIQLKLY